VSIFFTSYEHVQSTLDSITKSIIVENKNYTMCGIINYISYGNCKEKLNQGHYIATLYTGIQWYEYNDLKKKFCFIIKNNNIGLFKKYPRYFLSLDGVDGHIGQH